MAWEQMQDLGACPWNLWLLLLEAPTGEAGDSRVLVHLAGVCEDGWEGSESRAGSFG